MLETKEMQPTKMASRLRPALAWQSSSTILRQCFKVLAWQHRKTYKFLWKYGNVFFFISMEKSLWTTVGQLLCVLESNIEQWTSNRFGQWNLHQPERNTPRSPRDQVEVHARDTAQRVPLSQRCKHWHKPTWNIVKCEDKFMKFQQVYEINWN